MQHTSFTSKKIVTWLADRKQDYRFNELPTKSEQWNANSRLACGLHLQRLLWTPMDMLLESNKMTDQIGMDFVVFCTDNYRVTRINTTDND